MRICATLMLAVALLAQDGQHATPPGWPCVAGRPVDPSFLESSEATGGQVFLLQRNEASHTSLILNAPRMYPATILRAVGNLNGTREFEFPIDSGVQGVMVLASMQCRQSIQILRPDGAELTAANSAQSVDLQTGRILRVDGPEMGQWRLRLSGTGLFIVAVLAKAEVRLAGVDYTNQALEARLTGQASGVRFHLVGPSGERIADLGAAEPAGGVYRVGVQQRLDRFRVVVTGTDAKAWPFQRTYPPLFNASSRRPRS